MQLSDWDSERDTRRRLLNALYLIAETNDTTVESRGVASRPLTYVGEGSLVWSYPATSNYPAWRVIKFVGGMLVCIGGAIRQDLIDKMVGDRNTLTELFVNRDGFHPAVQEMTDAIVNKMASHQIVWTQPAFMIGHSLGGAIAACLSVEMQNQFHDTRRIWTFGSPRPGGPAAQQRAVNINTHRYYCVADPVRQFPPHYNEAYSIWPFISQATRNLWNAAVQVPVGFGIGLGGDIQQGEDITPTNGGPAILSLARYWFGLETGYSQFHSIEFYQDLIRSRDDDVDGDFSGIGGSYGEQPAEQSRPREQEAVNLGFLIQEKISRGVIPREDGFGASITPTYTDRVRAKKRDGIWTVEIGDHIVDVGPGKRAAKRKARQINASNRQSR